MVEKYLKIDDFLEYIILTQDAFLSEELKNVQSVEEQKSVQATYIINFLLQIQDVVNFDKTVEMMINYKIHNMLLEELFE